MHDQAIGAFLDQLADRVPAPGGGASAALHAAQAAALLGMVARYSDGPKYAEHEPLISRVRTETDAARAEALQLAQDDATAFGAVATAYGLPKATDEEKAARSAAIAEALIGAAEPPARTIELAARLAVLGEELLPVSNRNVLSDVAAAAEAARAAALTAQVNVEINLGGIKDEAARASLAARAEAADAVAARSAATTAAVRKEINR
ncbi:formiminotetrahydrofolate cyclodeaminase [Kitasatospora sp. MAP12-15]|uniref:cyclodeaminase/cyclohydrolase family protein n=1 Tax=unclassified Kitasatospora TaxID=2633591 RepID=UPI0024747EE4|nr:cyclodeaminase/cyclohydrolase family protein [Kitasatospora sp. MAP12-44]MDH6114479.1 formiminotetrahydrofolate cyclodeaminase [Kitasatospora sp. MAP12-44]